MSDEIVVFNDVNPYTGRRCLFVKRAGQPVDLAKWLLQVPDDVRSLAVFDQFEMEQGKHLQWHCLRVDWAPRELIGFEVDDSRLATLNFSPRIIAHNGRVIPAVSWTLLKNDRLSGAIRSAAELYWGRLNVWPQFALVRSLPKNAPSELQIENVILKLIEATWIWRGLVIVV